MLDTIYGLRCPIVLSIFVAPLRFIIFGFGFGFVHGISSVLHIRRVGVALCAVLVLLTGFSGFNGYCRSFTTLFIAVINARIFHFWAASRSIVCVSVTFNPP